MYNQTIEIIKLGRYIKENSNILEVSLYKAMEFHNDNRDLRDLSVKEKVDYIKKSMLTYHNGEILYYVELIDTIQGLVEMHQSMLM